MSRDVNNKFWDEELETLPREELEKRQLEDLKEIVKFAYDNAPYYKRSFDEAGVSPRTSRPSRTSKSSPLSTRKLSVTLRASAHSLVSCVQSPRRTLYSYQHRQVLREFPQ
ncbi:hypothetical protein [Ruminococcus sp.]|uniref:hypothetical protein n=1 Tax=Ruminococcus sp. TaxID=41978 RepID=UPI0032C21CFE